MKIISSGRRKSKKSEDSERLCPFCVHFVQIGRKTRCDIYSESERKKLMKSKNFECPDYINIDEA